MKKKLKRMLTTLERNALKLLLALLTINSLQAQQRTWMLPYYQNSGGVSTSGGVPRVPIINFKTGVPTYETKYIGGSFSTQAVGNGEYCNNCATDQITKLSQFFISGRAADVFQGNTYAPNPLRTLYTKWDQICGDTARVDTFQTASHVDLAHESLNEVAIGDGETAGSFWVVMQQSPANIDGFGPGFYVYLMDMNNNTINSNTIIQIDHAHFDSIPAGNNFGEGVALGSRFKYAMQSGETNPNLIALNGKYCRSIYIASYKTIYHLIIDVAQKTVIFSDSKNMVATTSGNMFMEIDLNYPVGGKHPTNLGLTGWGGVYIYNTSPDNGKLIATQQPEITSSVGGYGLEFDKKGINMYYSIHGSNAAASLFRVTASSINFSTPIVSTPISISPALGVNPNNTNNNYIALESAIDGNIYGLTGNQEMITIQSPEFSPSAVTSIVFTTSMFHNPTTGAADLNPGNNSNFLFGLSLPDWVDGEVPHVSDGGTIAVKIPCNVCDLTYQYHTIDVYAGTTQTSSSLIQHYNASPCDTLNIKACPGMTYHVIYDMGLPNQQDSWQTIAFAGDYHFVSFNLSANGVNYLQYNTNTTLTAHSTLWDNKVYIADNVIVTVGANDTLDITNVDVIFGFDAGIDFKEGAVLRANNSVFRPCAMNGVWRGLAFYGLKTAPSGLINECTFKNAKVAVEGLGNSTSSLLALDLRVTNNLFADCQRAVSFNYVNLARSITGNTYMLDDKNLPFSTINSSSVNPPKTTAPTNQNDYYGILSTYTTFHDLIGQNDFVMASDSTNGDQMSYGISLYNSNSATISSNKLTDFSYGITTYTSTNVSIEENTLEWTNLYKKVIPNQYKFHITVYSGQNILIKGNNVYSANLINTNPGASQLDGGANGPSSPTYKSCGIGLSGGNNIVIKQNQITGIETGISAIGVGIAPNVSKNLYITDNDIEKSWYYGIYIRSYENTDVACNTINMELKTGREATGIGYFNLLVTPAFMTSGYANPVNFALRSNCVLNTKNAIYCYSPSAAGAAHVPKIYNNFLYNYTRVGFENNGFSQVSTANPYDVNRNSFVSNNSTSSLPDVISDASHTLTGNFNYGIQNYTPTFTLLNTTNGNSSASCAMQTSTNANSLDSTQICDYLYQRTISWTPNGRVADWSVVSPDSLPSTDQPYDLSDPIYGSYTEIVNVKEKMFDVYPVPSTEKVTIKYNIEEADNAFLEIVDVQGRILKTVPLTFEFTTIDVNIAELTPGVYVVRMTNAGKTAYYSKLIKQ